ncbi:hypothetical protein [Arthrobacter flavus]|uniref:Uncharacterized protein n=1 Tax=Arthrobacter flavus TaxID=95172 RepID=A0ABW4Q6X8_9MICC
MFDYESRLSAALRSRGASDSVVHDAALTLKEFPLDDDGLIREFGEPEEYAKDLMSDAKPRLRFAFIVTGLVLGVLAWFGLRAAKESGWEALEPVSNFGALIGLLLIGLGVLAEFFRYLYTGRHSRANRR